MADCVLTDRDGGILTVTLNRPEKRNAMNGEMVAQLVETLEAAARDASLRVIIIRANGVSFCSGLDLRIMAAQREKGEADLGPLEVVLQTLDAVPQPTIAAVQGDAVAGGCELALYCDIRVVADTARFSMPLARIGLALPVTLTWKLLEIIGVSKTYELLFTGEAVAAETALKLGMANRVVPPEELDASARSLAQQIAHNAPLSVRTMKAFVQRGLEIRRALQRDDLDELHRRIRQSSDLKEGLAAQREKRRPIFKGH